MIAKQFGYSQKFSMKPPNIKFYENLITYRQAGRQAGSRWSGGW